MTKKDYELIASVLKANRDDGGETTIIYWMADKFEETNPRFDRERFLKACGIKD